MHAVRRKHTTARLAVALSLSASLLVLPDVPAHAAATIRVPEDYATISAAITAAASGDTIDIAPGTYSGAIVLSKPVTLRGRTYDPNDPTGNTTILQATATEDVVTIPSGVSPARRSAVSCSGTDYPAYP